MAVMMLYLGKEFLVDGLTANLVESGVPFWTVNDCLLTASMWHQIFETQSTE